jgi:hypothetical protein
MRSHTLAAAAAGLGAIHSVHAQSVTIYGQVPLGQQSQTGSGTNTAAAASYTGSAAYDPLVLQPPPVPSGLAQNIPYTFPGSPQAGVSIQQNGSFLGWSIEMSVTNQALGKNSTLLAVPFLNLMSNLVQRAGQVNIRVGGNSQETAVLVDSIADGRILEKDHTNVFGRTGTPPLVYTADLLYMMGNITKILDGVHWWLGVPFFETDNPKMLDIAQLGEEVLGDHLLGLQIGNEPDFYLAHQHRNKSDYGPFDYFGEFGDLITKLGANSSIPVKNNLLAPSVASAFWTPEMVWQTGFLDAYRDSLKYIAVEHYPTDNCNAVFGGGPAKDPQQELGNFTSHQSGQTLVQPYVNSAMIAQNYSKPFIMFETNTASCGGFAGISNSFTAALWALDYGLTMAYSNFTGANMHVGGQSTYYNPFTPPPTNQSSFHQWTVGPIFYSAMFISEAFGKSGTAQILDIFPQSQYQPNYAIYEGGKPSKLALINWASDTTGASDYVFSFGVDGGVPGSVKVKYLLAPTLTSKDNITWAGQTFGGVFESDGRLKGTLNITTVSCDQGANVCNIRVPAPAAALVFLADDPAAAQGGSGDALTQTFSTSALTKVKNTATVDPSVLATSNGNSAKDRLEQAATSKGGLKNKAERAIVPGAAVLVAMMVGAWTILRATQ